jgi:hypothetical protein
LNRINAGNKKIFAKYLKTIKKDPQAHWVTALLMTLYEVEDGYLEVNIIDVFTYAGWWT